jgi:hypothetical protein
MPQDPGMKPPSLSTKEEGNVFGQAFLSSP